MDSIVDKLPPQIQAWLQDDLIRPVLIVIGAMLLLNLPTVVYKVGLAIRAVLYFVLCWDKSWKLPQDPGSIFGPHLSQGLPVERKTVYFVRHGESTWNDTFNKGSHRTWTAFLIGFFPGLVKAVLYEIYLLLAGRMDRYVARALAHRLHSPLHSLSHTHPIPHPSLPLPNQQQLVLRRPTLALGIVASGRTRGVLEPARFGRTGRCAPDRVAGRRRCTTVADCMFELAPGHFHCCRWIPGPSRPSSGRHDPRIGLPPRSESQSGYVVHHTHPFYGASFVDRKVVESVRLSRNLQHSDGHVPSFGEQTFEHEWIEADDGILRIRVFWRCPRIAHCGRWTFDLVPVLFQHVLAVQRPSRVQKQKDCQRWDHHL